MLRMKGSNEYLYLYVYRYIDSTAKKYDIVRQVRFKHHMRSCTWLSDEQKWRLEVSYQDSDEKEKAKIFMSRFVVTASGPLQVPAYPSNIGVSNRGGCDFKGPAFHTARWDDSVSLEGKRVGVIGTGASAIQLIPAIADRVKHLHVFQRTPPWVGYKLDCHIPKVFKFILRYVPFAMTLLRCVLYWAMESRFMTLISGSLFNKILKVDLTSFMKREIPDDKLREKLTPNFEPACKRLLFHNTYLRTFSKENVTLETDGIVAVRDNGIEVKRGDATEIVDLDVIIFSTGFHINRSTNEANPGDNKQFDERGHKLDAPNAYQLDIVGENGFTSAQWSKQGPRAYMGVSAPAFPNMFFLLGPNTTLAHNSVIFMAECQVNYTINLLKKMKQKSLKKLAVKKSVLSSYYDWVRQDMANKVDLFII